MDLPYENISPEEVARLLEDGQALSIIDVREPDEFASGHIPGAKNIAINTLPELLNEFDKDQEHIIVCHAGVRSEAASNFLGSNGYRVKNMYGGMLDWTGDTEI